MNLDIIMGELKDYGKALRSEDREILEELLKKVYAHYGAISFANSMHAWAFLILSIMIEKEKEVR
jgi:hypothetical protein